jgi:hypothetical protein
MERYWVWKTAGKTAKLLMMKFAYRSTFYLYYVARCKKPAEWGVKWEAKIILGRAHNARRCRHRDANGRKKPTPGGGGGGAIDLYIRETAHSVRLAFLLTGKNQGSWMTLIRHNATRFFTSCFFSWISFPQALEYTIRTASNFFKNSRRFSQFNVHHQKNFDYWIVTLRLQK